MPELVAAAKGADAAHDIESGNGATDPALASDVAGNKSDESNSRDQGNNAANQEKPQDDLDWNNHPDNALNWPGWRKGLCLISISLMALTASVGTSIVSPAQVQFMREFNVGEVVALLPLSLYVFALAFGPVVGGPLSESYGRLPVYQGTCVVGLLFTVGAALVHNFGGLCFLRFMAGFSWGTSLAIGSGTIVEMYHPKQRGLAMALFILMPFLGPGVGPIIGAFAVSRQGWRWTQWILVIFSGVSLVLLAMNRDTYPPAIKRRLARKLGLPVNKDKDGAMALAKEFLTIGLLRPIHMILVEPLVFLLGIYISVNFGVLFSFFAAVPYTFRTVYAFSVEQAGLVFLAVMVGCLLGIITVVMCEGTFYVRQIPKHPPHKVPPEHRLYSAMIGSFGPPIGLFWYAWTAKSSISWASPAVAILPFSWGNLLLFISFTSYMADTYKSNVVASQASANSLMRYAFAGAFPLFIVTSKFYKLQHMI